MIVFDLKCDQSHIFEVWFRSSTDFEDQKAKGIVECPFCGSHNVAKAIMEPNVGAKSNQQSASPTDSSIEETDTSPAAPQAPAAAPKPTHAASLSASGPASGPASGSAPKELAALSSETSEMITDMMQKVRRHVENTCENVGKDFAEEARKIHYGESEERPIYGESSFDEAQDLIEEGIDVLPLPSAPKTQS